MSDINFIDIDPKNDEQILISKFEELTERTLYPAQDERILIQLIVYYGNLLQTKFNNAAKLNLVEYSRYPILDFLGRQKSCERLENETDENYIKRILLSPEGYSVAGPENAYLYFILSSDSSIVDAAIEVPDENAFILLSAPLEGEVAQSAIRGYYEFITNSINNSTFSASMNYEKEEIELTFNETIQEGTKLKVRIPHPYKVITYVLTEDGEASEEILKKVSETLEEVRPLTDYVIPKSAVVETFEISGIVYLTKNADETVVKKEINEALNRFLLQFKSSLNKSIIINQIIARVCSVDGVYDFKLLSPEATLAASPKINYRGNIGTITYERALNE